MGICPGTLVAIVGPTGSGKSAAALRLALRFGGEIVNCDSVQIYRYFDAGTAKLLLPERLGIPHHLIDIVEPDQLFTAGDYVQLARPLLRKISSRGKLPIVVGGTGFYLRALLEGLSEGPPRDAELRERLVAREARRPGSLHRILMRLDPESGARIHPNDRSKTLRALELRLLRRTGRPTLPPPEPITGFQVLKIGLNPDRTALYARLDVRLEAMFRGGLIEEVHSLLARGISPDAKPFESLGYKQVRALIAGRMTYAEALADAQQATRNYAKRQWTWFRRDREVRWIQGFGEESSVSEQTESMLRGDY